MHITADRMAMVELRGLLFQIITNQSTGYLGEGYRWHWE